jgi:hypothetical protein
MPFLKINGYPLPVADGQCQETLELLGDTARAFDGTRLSTLLASKRVLQVATTPLAALEAEPLRCLLNGGDVTGQKWSFDDTSSTNWQWSSKGLGKASGSGTSLGSGKFGAGLRIAAAGQVTWAPGAATQWTLMVWRYSALLSAWQHWILCSDGTKYLAGAATGTSITWLAFSGGVLTLGDSGSATNQDFDDLVFLPCVITAAQAAVFGVATTAFSELPKLTLTGDVIPETTRSAAGEEVSSELVQAMIGGAWDSTGRRLSARLVEV